MKHLLILSLFLFSVSAWAQETAADTAATTDTIGIYIPVDLDDALSWLDTLLAPEQIERIQEMETEEDFAAQAHFGFGMWLRNNWGLWSGSRLAQYFNGLGLFHPDDMSGVILVSYFRRLHDQPINLEGQVSLYRAYWEEQRRRQVEGGEER